MFLFLKRDQSIFVFSGLISHQLLIFKNSLSALAYLSLTKQASYCVRVVPYMKIDWWNPHIHVYPLLFSCSLDFSGSYHHTMKTYTLVCAQAWDFPSSRFKLLSLQPKHREWLIFLPADARELLAMKLFLQAKANL
jgi:hypothetical protein